MNRFCIVVCLVVLSGCDAAKATMAKVTGDNIMVTTSPASVTVPAGAKQYFTASVANTSDQRVRWSVIGVGCGTITIDGVYRAPTVTPGNSCAVRAVAEANTKKNGDSSVAVGPPISISVSPTSATVAGCLTQTYTATVTNTSNIIVNWNLIGAGCGLITIAGVYRAPPSPPTGSCFVRATSVIDETKSAEVQVTPTNMVINSLTVTPSSVTVAPGGQVLFSATLNTSCGPIPAQ